MANQALTTKVAQGTKTSWQNKAMAVASTVGTGFSIANGIREALPVIGNVARTAAQYLPLVAAPFGF